MYLSILALWPSVLFFALAISSAWMIRSSGLSSFPTGRFGKMKFSMYFSYSQFSPGTGILIRLVVFFGIFVLEDVEVSDTTGCRTC
jgi:hypothetical protein